MIVNCGFVCFKVLIFQSTGTDVAGHGLESSLTVSGKFLLHMHTLQLK